MKTTTKTVEKQPIYQGLPSYERLDEFPNTPNYNLIRAATKCEIEAQWDDWISSGDWLKAYKRATRKYQSREAIELLLAQSDQTWVPMVELLGCALHWAQLGESQVEFNQAWDFANRLPIDDCYSFLFFAKTTSDFVAAALAFCHYDALRELARPAVISVSLVQTEPKTAYISVTGERCIQAEFAVLPEN